jgi:hypothetical protein
VQLGLLVFYAGLLVLTDGVGADEVELDFLVEFCEFFLEVFYKSHYKIVFKRQLVVDCGFVYGEIAVVIVIITFFKFFVHRPLRTSSMGFFVCILNFLVFRFNQRISFEYISQQLINFCMVDEILTFDSG